MSLGSRALAGEGPDPSATKTPVTLPLDRMVSMERLKALAYGLRTPSSPGSAEES